MAEPTGFERFYKRYLRHVGLQEAKKAWGKIHPDVFLENEIMEGLEWYITHEWANRPIDKVPHPATWLNQRRWEDAKGGTPHPLSAVPEGRPNFRTGLPEFIEPTAEERAEFLAELAKLKAKLLERLDMRSRLRLRNQTRTPF